MSWTEHARNESLTPACNYSVWMIDTIEHLSDDPASLTPIKRKLFLLNAVFYKFLTPIVVLFFGIPGDVFNLVTLSSANLQSVPFMYIRAIAFFDLIGLVCVSTFCTRVLFNQRSSYWVAFYRSHIELTVLNSAFTASLYTAVILTIERYLMVCRPTRRHSLQTVSAANPRLIAGRNIATAALLGVSLHIPMSAQWVRLGSVLTILILNLIITKHLQSAKRKRRILKMKVNVKESLQQPNGRQHLTVGEAGEPAGRQKTSSPSTSGGGGSRRISAAVMNSFTEKRLTAMMIGITVIYVLGNGPQALVMIVNSDSLRKHYNFQVLRSLANFSELLNHCVNFYVFCITSKEYSRTFLSNCLCLKSCLEKTFCITINLRKNSAGNYVVETESTSFRNFAAIEEDDECSLVQAATALEAERGGAAEEVFGSGGIIRDDNPNKVVLPLKSQPMRSSATKASAASAAGTTKNKKDDLVYL